MDSDPKSARGKERATSDQPPSDSQREGPISVRHSYRISSTPPPEKLELLGNMADAVAHEMNNVLAATLGLASVLATEIDPATSAFRDVQGIISASKRGLQLTKSLLGFAHGAELETERVSLNDLVGVTRGLLLRTLSKDTEIQLELAQDLADVECNPALMKQALLNLGLNAGEAIREKGTVSFFTDNVEIDRTAGEKENLPPGRYVRIRISDTGAGMSRDMLSQAFEPFFTTKQNGTGLGLAQVAHSIRRHAGGVSIYSKPGLGTTVTIYLPALEPAPEAVREESATSVPPRAGSATVLVVDDDELVLRSARRLLQTLGYNALAVKDGDQAVERYRTLSHKIDVVLLDLVMPNKDGLEVLRDLKKIDPDVRVLISSGYPMDELGPQARALGAVGFVQKPLTLESLPDALSVALGPEADASSFTPSEHPTLPSQKDRPLRRPR